MTERDIILRIALTFGHGSPMWQYLVDGDEDVDLSQYSGMWPGPDCKCKGCRDDNS